LPVVEARLTSVNSAPSQTIVLKPSNAEIDIALADLAVTNPNMRPNLETRLASAANQLPDDPEAEEALGYLALRQGRSSEARVHFQLAVDRHSSDPNVSFYLAHLEHETGAPSSQVIPLLERALTLKPDLSEARLELGLIAASDGSFTKALEALRHLTGLRPANAYAAAYTAAYCYAHIAKFSEACIAARQAQTLAQNDHDRAANSELINYINQEAQELMASSTNLP
jgi:Flp pilus assembly protein TadD